MQRRQKMAVPATISDCHGDGVRAHEQLQRAALAASLFAWKLRRLGEKRFCPSRTTRAAVLEKNDKEKPLRSVVRVVFLNKRRVSLPRLAIWGARRAIFAATGPESESGHATFFCLGAPRSHHGGRVDGILSVRGPEVSRGSLLVGSRRAQAPIPCAPPLPSIYTYQPRC